jgi:hypothetical protein
VRSGVHVADRPNRRCFKASPRPGQRPWMPSWRADAHSLCCERNTAHPPGRSSVPGTIHLTCCHIVVVFNRGAGLTTLSCTHL